MNGRTNALSVSSPEPPIPDPGTLCFTSILDGSEVKYRFERGTVATDGIKYTTDKVTWNTWNGSAITLNKGDKMWVKNTRNTLSDSNNHFAFHCAGALEISGNVHSMINNAQPYPYCYQCLFYTPGIVSAANLELGSYVANNCYDRMFMSCTDLVIAPQLPATALAEGCYNSMFWQCTRLRVPPMLTHLTSCPNYCCASMFKSSGLVIRTDSTTEHGFVHFLTPPNGSSANAFNEMLPDTWEYLTPEPGHIYLYDRNHILGV